MARPRKNNLDQNLKQKSSIKQHEDPFIAHGSNVGAVARGYIEDIESVNEEMAALRKKKREIKVAAKKDGFDSKTLEVIIKKRAVDNEIRLLHEAEVSRVEKAIGMETLFEYLERTQNGVDTTPGSSLAANDTENDADSEAA